MHATRAPRSTRILALLSVLGLALAALACGDPSPEEQLAEATQELATANQAKGGAKAALDQLDERLEEVQAGRDEAALAYEAAVERWREAKDAVGEFATDEVLHQQVNRALLDAEDLQDATITARVDRRVVTLNGRASSQEDVEAAETLAIEIPGVARVTSLVVLEPPSEPSLGSPAAEDEPPISSEDPDGLGDPTSTEAEAPDVQERQI